MADLVDKKDSNDVFLGDIRLNERVKFNSAQCVNNSLEGTPGPHFTWQFYYGSGQFEGIYSKLFSAFVEPTS